MTGEELEALVTRCLEERVPAVLVSRVFDLDLELVKKAQSQVRIKEYGTDDEGEYIEQLKWDAIAKARQILATGSAAEQKNVLATVLGKQYALAARRTPESVRNSQDAVLGLLEGMRTGKGKARDTEPSKFIARRDPEAS